MTNIFILHHVRADDVYGESAKLIGAYQSEQHAREAIHRLANQPGFRDYTTGFVIDVYELNKDHWVEGFGLD